MGKMIVIYVTLLMISVSEGAVQEAAGNTSFLPPFKYAELIRSMSQVKKAPDEETFVSKLPECKAREELSKALSELVVYEGRDYYLDVIPEQAVYERVLASLKPIEQ